MPQSTEAPLPWPVRGVYAVTPEGLTGPDLAAAVANAVENGVAAVQYRDKSADPARRRRDAAALVAVCRPRRVPLIVNDDVELAAAAGADGVHLGRDDEALAAARARLGDAVTVGVSCYDDAGRARAAARGGADYVAFGSFFPSLTKPGAIRATTGLAAAVRPSVTVPIVAIGGITAENAPPLLAAGIDLVAIVNAIFGAPDIGRATRRLVGLFS
ncbi:MAG: thiamine phosphate synthase [Immundisolibacterales bacterium]|nr:thiamine phosphate synthase [Immundisolibacterales bacterium]